MTADDKWRDDITIHRCGVKSDCQHRWDGEPYVSEDGRTWSSTCSKCGMTSFDHFMQNTDF